MKLFHGENKEWAQQQNGDYFGMGDVKIYRPTNIAFEFSDVTCKDTVAIGLMQIYTYLYHMKWT